ncbi:hypothetical protein SCLCIDRAFT_29027 [Scleroderma citrinum Foug A]|uniref:ATP-dependent DNA helicase n=1 Tax=Scleroderma citrinum Foug A TaxID=1036808 RepID=A0A0C2ZXJ5_9AGAM|nr:hypothetical protein SCLCIDRAFT_29027 [Scleroderma citrinum Foug A]
MEEAIATLTTPRQLRHLFVHLLVNDCILAPIDIWTMYQQHMAHDFTLQLGLNIDLGLNRTLEDLNKSLEEHGKSLSSYGLPDPISFTAEVQHELERWGHDPIGLHNRVATAIALMTHEQHFIYNQIMSSILKSESHLAFVDGKAGQGKTFLINAICDKVHSLGRIVIPTATAAFAAQLYPGGRTTHSTFKVPVNDKNEMLLSPIKPSDPCGELIKEASLIIWDKGPMVNHTVLACVNEVCRTVMQNELPFGGKIIVILGDFRQTCPIIHGGTRAQVIDAVTSAPKYTA